MQRRYWDADAFLSYLKGESDRVERCRAVLAEAEAGRIQIVTSALTLAEVLWLKGHTPVPAEDRERLRSFFRSPWLVLVELDRRLAEAAQDVLWKHGIRPKDAAHVATAVATQALSLDTFDEGLIAASGKIGDPPLRIGWPEAGNLLAPPMEGS